MGALISKRMMPLFGLLCAGALMLASALFCPNVALAQPAEVSGSARIYRLIGQIMCLILGVGAGQRPFFMGKVIRIDFPTRTKSVSGY